MRVRTNRFWLFIANSPATLSRPRASRAFWRGSAMVLLLSTSFAGHARAEEAVAAPATTHYQLSHFAINFDDPESQIPTIAERNADPLEFGYFLQDLAAEALRAERKKEYGKAVKFWRASAKAVPDEAVAFSHACAVYQVMGEREHALEYCARALNLRGVTSAEYLRYAELMIAQPEPLTAAQVQDLDAAIGHLRTQPTGTEPASVIECQMGVKLEDEARLARCTAVLAKSMPNDPHTLTYLWSLAMKRRNYGEARGLLDEMAKTSMQPSALADLRAATAKASAWWRRPFQDPRYGFALICLVGLGAWLIVRKRAQLRDATPGAGAAPAA